MFFMGQSGVYELENRITKKENAPHGQSDVLFLSDFYGREEACFSAPLWKFKLFPILIEQRAEIPYRHRLAEQVALA